MEHSETAELWARFEIRLPEIARMRVLDFGCGDGRFSRRLAAAGARVFGVDADADKLYAARVLRTPAVFRRVSLTRLLLPFDGDKFDMVWSCTALQRVPDEAFERTCDELRRVLRPNGYAMLFENTAQTGRRTSGDGLTVLRKPSEYVEQFPGIEIVDEWSVGKESHTLFVGRVVA